jgi:hypothetical protein
MTHVGATSTLHNSGHMQNVLGTHTNGNGTILLVFRTRLPFWYVVLEMSFRKWYNESTRNYRQQTMTLPPFLLRRHHIVQLVGHRSPAIIEEKSDNAAVGQKSCVVVSSTCCDIDCPCLC